MVFLHLSDLHLGKRVRDYELYAEQRHALDEIVAVCDARCPDAVVIAGDVYDKPVPAVEAVRLFDNFLEDLSARDIPVLLVSGNHDSGERLGFASGLLGKNGIHIAGAFSGAPMRVTLNDAHGPVNFWLLPFLRPATVRAAFARDGLATDGITDYTSAARAAVARADIDTAARNVLVAHQFVTARGEMPERCDSESLTTGGLEDVDLSAFDGFDYVALGHLHGPQRIGRDTVRYAGSPLAYSVSEQHHKKSICLVTLGEKGAVSTALVPLHPLRGMRAVTGTLEQLCAANFPGREPNDDYVFATLTDDAPLDDPLARLRLAYPRLLGVAFARQSTGAADFDPAALDAARLDPMTTLDEFFEAQLGRPLSDEQRVAAKDAFARTAEVTT